MGKNSGIAQERTAHERTAKERKAQKSIAQSRIAPGRIAQKRIAQERMAQERIASLDSPFIWQVQTSSLNSFSLPYRVRGSLKLDRFLNNRYL